MEWSNIFFNDDFTVDQCLSGYTQKSDLETLRKSLKNYGHDLQRQMTEILKNETEAIVNLAEYLTNLNSKIDSLSIPISQLREEIRTLHDLIETAEVSYRRMLNDIKNNNTTKNHIFLKLGILKCSLYVKNLINSLESDSPENLLTLEYTVNKYSFQRTYMDELNLMTHDIEDVVGSVEKKLIDMINKRFLTAFQNSDKNTIVHCLRMYDNLQKENEAHKIFQIKVVRPAFSPLFSEHHLEKCNYDIDKIYDEVLTFLNTKVQILTNILQENPELQDFNFILNSLWIELHKQSCEGLPHITAPGNPELFQKRFTSTCRLLETICEKCGNKDLLKQDEIFQEHLKRFNLPVYFEIKFQQIAGNFESDIFNVNLSNNVAPHNEQSFKLKPTVFLWNALLQCFHKDVYIDQLADQFIKLSMMLLSRYIRFIETSLKDNNSSNDKLEGFIIYSLVDVNLLSNLVAPKCKTVTDVDKTIFNIMSKDMRHIILKLFVVKRNMLSQIKVDLKNHLIHLKVDQSSSPLQNVAALPRLYRRTNRLPPKEASSYIIEAVKPILEFHKRFHSTALTEELEEILDVIITKLTDQYLRLVQEVLESLCKTEESLRRLKSRNTNLTEDSTGSQQETMSDEKKIRQQIKYDVGYFCDKLYPLGSENSKGSMDCLRRETV